jgi:hypothetical protein
MNREEITPSQRSRLAYVYIRQSSFHQVREHLESQNRQRALVHHAVDLGWPRQRVVEVDEDLGVSASRASRKRAGFQDMVADVALGKIGLVLALEAPRLSRSNRDWYHLLDICAITFTLIADGEGLYDPLLLQRPLAPGTQGHDERGRASCHAAAPGRGRPLQSEARRAAPTSSHGIHLG